MHGHWGPSQMMFPKNTIVVDDDVDVHNSSEIASGIRLGINATKRIPGEDFKRPWPPLIKMDEALRKKINSLPVASWIKDTGGSE